MSAAPAAAQVEAPAAALARDAATWGAVAGVAPADAEAQLRAQGETAGLTEALAAEFRDRLAGIAVEHVPAYRIVVLLTGDVPVAERHVTAGGLDVAVTFRTGALASHERLLAALTQHQAAIRAMLRRPPGLGIDARVGALAVLVSETDAVRYAPDELEGQLADLTGVPVVVRRLDRTDDTAAEGGARMVGLDPTDGKRHACTSGFVVSDGTRSGLVTAAHCPDTLAFVEPDRTETPLPFVGQWGWSYQDVQLHVSDTALPPRFFADTARTLSRTPVAAGPRSHTRVGDVVCHRGERTGYSCAEVAYTDFAPPGDLCGGPCAPSWVAVEGPTCGPGDSGGPVFIGSVALGLMKGASFRPDKSCSLYYYMSTDYLPTGWRVATDFDPPRDGEVAPAQRATEGVLLETTRSPPAPSTTALRAAVSLPVPGGN